MLPSCPHNLLRVGTDWVGGLLGWPPHFSLSAGTPHRQFQPQAVLMATPTSACRSLDPPRPDPQDKEGPQLTEVPAETQKGPFSPLKGPIVV